MKKLLLIDDDDAMRKLLRSRLQHSYEIFETGDPEEGIVLALQQKPDAILLDLMMPRYSGFEVCQTLSSMSFTQRIPVLIVSGECAERYRDFCKNLGARGFFQKPIDFAALERELDAVIAGAQNTRRPEARVRFRTPLRLSGRDAKGAPLDVSAVTENVTATGFVCLCPAGIREGTAFEVHLAMDGRPFVGTARVVYVNASGASGQMCEFRFLETPIGWVLP